MKDEISKIYIEGLIKGSNKISINRIDRDIKRIKKNLTSEKKYDKLSNNFFSLYKNEDESILEAKKRFFLSIPKEEGALRLHQENLTKLLRIFHGICGEAGVGYALKGGSLIGAIRHSGFIPWDDDIDIIMLYSDFLKLIEYIKINLDDSFEIWYSYPSRGGFYLPKFSIKNMRFLFIDIFNLEIIDLSSSRKKMRKSFRNFRKEDGKTALKFEGDFEKITELGKKHINEFQKEFTIKDKKNALAQVPCHTFLSDIHKISNILPFREVDFEDIKTFVPNKPEKYLGEMGTFRDIYSFPTKRHMVHFNADKNIDKAYEIQEVLRKYDK